MYEIMLRGLLAIVNDMANDKAVDFNAWLRHAITIASTNATYGRLLKCGGRELERNVALLLANIVPWLIAPETWNAWKVLCAAFKDYFDLRGYEDGS
ncbi:hypothetical protein N7530_008981 [Penicillium desertorum]|uniref:Uncharacterized protein n=1 Tax=Penicillium desertorum TaxID=1303715 RepID=A0A9X0BLH8_9EURO|nr:hypothetical protein N7530_008981 [Penicillium desertorum]